MEKTKEYFYIRNEGYIGNALMWWQVGGGYTCDIRQAEKFTEERAEKICQRPEDTAYNTKYIDSLKEAQKLIIDSQYVSDAMRLYKPDKLRPSFEVGQIVWLDFDLSNKSRVEVIEQTPMKLFTVVKDPEGTESWSVMSNRLRTIKK
jgi:uncharacterized protein (DUF1015 family)